jgi:hypothetical protein
MDRGISEHGLKIAYRKRLPHVECLAQIAYLYVSLFIFHMSRRISGNTLKSLLFLQLALPALMVAQQVKGGNGRPVSPLA